MTSPRGRPEGPRPTFPPEKRGRVLLRNAALDPADVPSATSGDNTLITNINDAVGRQRNIYTWWSEPQETVTISTVGAVKSLPNVVVADLPDNAIVTRVIVLYKFREVKDTSNATNDLDAACGVAIQMRHSASAAFIDAINLIDQQFQVGARERGASDVVFGTIDVTAEVETNINATYNFQFASVTSTGSNLVFRDVQMGLQVMWS